MKKILKRDCFFFFFCTRTESETPADVVVAARLVRGLVALGPRRRVRRRRRPDAQRRAGRHQLRYDRVPVHVPEYYTPNAASTAATTPIPTAATATAHHAHSAKVGLSRGQQQADQPVPVQRLGKLTDPHTSGAHMKILREGRF